MKLSKKLIAVPAIVIAAGISLTACGGGSQQQTAPAAAASAPANSQSAACSAWSQAKQAAGTGNNGDIAAVQADMRQATADTTDPTLIGYLQSFAVDAGNADMVAESVDIGNIDSYCNGSSVPATQAPAPAPTQAPVTQQQAPVATQAPAAPTQAPAAQSDAWSTAVAYTNDVNAGDNASAWNMLSSSVQSHGWGGSYNTYVADFTPLSFDNVTYSSSSGDSVTFTFTLHNHSTGSEGVSPPAPLLRGQWCLSLRPPDR